MSISEEDFIEACQNFQDCWLSHQTNYESWLEVKVLEHIGTRYLRIIKPFRLAESDEGSNNDSPAHDEDETIEADREALEAPTGQTYDLLILYDIVYSATYQVPVLYVTFQQSPGVTRTNSGTTTPTSLDAVYELLVPESKQSQVKDVGVMGALSMMDHPITGLPAYFVHPCQTGDVMHSLFDAPQAGESTEREMYLLVWIGLVGGSVGLDMPTDLAEYIIACSQPTSDLPC